MDATLQFASKYAADHPAEAARRLETLIPGEVAALLERIDPATAAGVLDHMVPVNAATHIGLMAADRSAEILGLLPTQRAVRVLRHLASDTRERVIRTLPAEYSVQLERVLRFPEGSAGGMADSSVEPLPSDMKLGEARLRARDPRLPYVYVVDREGRLIGVAHKRDVEAGDDAAELHAIVSPGVIRVPARATGAELQNHRAWRDLDALPVVDRRGVYLGAIRHKQLRELGEPDTRLGGAGRPLAGFLDLTEFYWMGLAAMIGALAAETPTIHQGRERHDER
jgi:magnesium transporter